MIKHDEEADIAREDIDGEWFPNVASIKLIIDALRNSPAADDAEALINSLEYGVEELEDGAQEQYAVLIVFRK